MAIMKINGGNVTYNNALVYINGEKSEINEWIAGIDYDTGTQSDHVQALSETADPLAVNSINGSPSGTIRFFPGAFQMFWTLLNNRFTYFSLTIEEYATGNLEGDTHTVSIIAAKFDGHGNSISAQQAASMRNLRFKATKIIE